MFHGFENIDLGDYKGNAKEKPPGLEIADQACCEDGEAVILSASDES